MCINSRINVAVPNTLVSHAVRKAAYVSSDLLDQKPDDVILADRWLRATPDGQMFDI
jgi:hypothetical protein